MAKAKEHVPVAADHIALLLPAVAKQHGPIPASQWIPGILIPVFQEVAEDHRLGKMHSGRAFTKVRGIIEDITKSLKTGDCLPMNRAEYRDVTVYLARILNLAYDNSTPDQQKNTRKEITCRAGYGLCLIGPSEKVASRGPAGKKGGKTADKDGDVVKVKGADSIKRAVLAAIERGVLATQIVAAVNQLQAPSKTLIA